LNILITPLDWGLGHATRSIPVIRACVEAGHRVILASSGRSLSLLKQEFPELTALEMPGYDIQYQAKGSFIFKIIAQLGKIFRGIRNEKKQTDTIVRTHGIDLIISDNRYGCKSRSAYSVIITHQMMVKVSWFKIAEPFIYLWLQWQHRGFNEIWIPDVKGNPNISGDLSHAYPVLRKTRYIGILTRFIRPAAKQSITGDVLAIISGPEPQRTYFEELLIAQARHIDRNFLLVRGLAGQDTESNPAKNIRCVAHLSGDRLFQEIVNSKIIISRGGYSTLMDLAQLEKKCIFIPTPGQTEQEYLVRALGKKQLAVAAVQRDLHLETAIQQTEHIRPFHIDCAPDQFMTYLEATLKKAEKKSQRQKL